MPDIASIVNTVTLSAFIGIFVVAILAFVRGLFRGWRYGTFRLLVFASFIAVALLVLPITTDALGNLNLQSFNLPAVSFVVDMGDGNAFTVAAEWTTPYETVTSLAYQFFAGMGIDYNPEELLAYAFSLAEAVISFVLLLVFAILVSFFAPIFSSLLWHLIFKRFIKKEKRKKSYRKGKLISGLEGMVTSVVVMALFLLPLTSIVNSVAGSWNDLTPEEETELGLADNEMYQTVSGALDAYENSLLSKVFFEWNRGQDGKSFDMAFVDFMTKGEYEDVAVSLIDELSTVGHAFSILVEGNMLSFEGFNKAMAPAFASSSLAPELLRAIGSSSLVTGLMPMVLELAVNIEPVSQYLLTDQGFDFRSYDFPNVFEEAADLYDSVIESGVLSSVVDENGALADSADIIENVLSTDHKGIFAQVFAALDSQELKLIDDLLETALYSMAYQESLTPPEEGAIGISSFLPEIANFDVDNNGVPDGPNAEFKSIKWGSEIALVYDNLLDVLTLDTDLLPTILPLILNPGDDPVTMVDPLMDLAVEKTREVAAIFCGVPEGEDFGDWEPLAARPLLDSSLLNYGMPEVLDLLDSSLESSLEQYEVAIDMESIKGQLLKTSGEENYDGQKTRVKGEFAALFEVVSDFTATEEGKEFLLNVEEMPYIYFEPNGDFIGAEDNLLHAVSGALENLDRSLVASEILPQVLNGFLTGEDSPLGQLGLKIDLENAENIGSEFATIIDLYIDNQDFMVYLAGLASNPGATSDLNSTIKTIASYGDSLANLLIGLGDSKLLNPVNDEGLPNQNIATLLTSFLEGQISDASIENIKSLIMNEGFDIETEARAFSNGLQEIASTNVIDIALNASGDIDIASFKDLDFAQVLAPLNESSLLEEMLVEILDDAIIPSLGSLANLPDGLSFRNVDNWVVEGESLNAIVKAATEVGDLANIDFLNSDPVAVSSIIRALSQSSLFSVKQADGSSDYVFPTFISDLLVGFMEEASGVSDFFKDYGTGTAEPTFNTLRGDIESIGKDEWVAESLRLETVIRALSQIDVESLSASKDFASLELKPFSKLLHAANESAAFGNSLIVNMFDYMNEALVDAGMTAFEKSNVQFLTRATIGERAMECDHLLTIVSAALDPETGIVNEQGEIAEIDVITANPDYLLQPIFDSMASSMVFNSLPSSVQDADTALTAFEEQCADLLFKARIYGNTEEDRLNIRQYVHGVSDDSRLDDSLAIDDFHQAWRVEVTSIVDVLRAVKESDIELGGDNLVAGLFSKDYAPHKNEQNRVAVENVLIEINECKTLYRAIPKILSDASANMDPSIGASLRENGNFYYNGDEPYDLKEINTLTFIMKDALSMDENALDLSSPDPALIDSLLSKMVESKVFNSLKGTFDSAVSTEYKTTPRSGLENGRTALTAFESAYADLLKNAGVFNESDSSDSALTVSESIAYVSEELPLVSESSQTAVWGKFSEAWGLEVERLVSTFEALGDTGLDLSNPSFDTYFDSEPDLKEEKLNVFLKALNDTDTLFRVIPKTLRDAVSSMPASLDFGTPNYECYGTHDRYASDEIARLSAIMRYGIGIGDNFDLATADIEKEVEPLLLNLSQSSVFNSIGSVNLDETNYAEPSRELTSFETVYSKLLRDSAYKDEPDLAEMSIRYVSTKNAVGNLLSFKSAWEKEVSQISLTLSAIKNSGLDLNDLNFDSFFAGEEAALESKRLVLEGILSNVNDSHTLFSMLPLSIEKSIGTIAGKFGSGQLNMNTVNYHYKGIDNPYGNDEIESLSFIMMNGMTIGDNVDLTIETMDTTVLEKLLGMAADLSTSHVFHSLSDSAVPSENTFFEEVISFIFSDDIISGLFYDEKSPKDMYYNSSAIETYNDAKGKARLMSSIYYARMLADEEFVRGAYDERNKARAYIEGDTGSIKAAFSGIIDNEALRTALVYGTFQNITEPQITEVLRNFNSCPLLFDFVPNIIDNFVVKAGDEGLSVGTIDFRQANPFFSYGDLAEANLDNSKYWTASYGDADIEGVTSLLFFLKENASDFKNIASDTSGTGTDLAVVVDNFGTAMKMMLESKVFNPETSYYDYVGVDLMLRPTVPYRQNDLTVFEQFLYFLYDVSSIGKMAYGSETQYAMPDGSLIAVDNYEDNLWIRIKLGRTMDLVGTTKGGSHENEIAMLFDGDVTQSGLLAYLVAPKAAGGLGLTSLKFDSDGSEETGLAFDSLNPELLTGLLARFNRLDITHGTIANQLERFLNDTAGFGKFTQGTVDPIENWHDYHRSQPDYETQIIPGMTPLLKALYKNDGTYMNIGDLSAGDNGLLALLQDETFFDSIVSFINLDNGFYRPVGLLLENGDEKIAPDAASIEYAASDIFMQNLLNFGNGISPFDYFSSGASHEDLMNSYVIFASGNVDNESQYLKKNLLPIVGANMRLYMASENASYPKPLAFAVLDPKSNDELKNVPGFDELIANYHDYEGSKLRKAVISALLDELLSASAAYLESEAYFMANLSGSSLFLPPQYATNRWAMLGTTHEAIKVEAHYFLGSSSETFVIDAMLDQASPSFKWDAYSALWALGQKLLGAMSGTSYTPSMADFSALLNLDVSSVYDNVIYLATVYEFFSLPSLETANPLMKAGVFNASFEVPFDATAGFYNRAYNQIKEHYAWN